MEESFSVSSAGEEMYDPDYPHFSIIIPLYNKGAYIARALDSIAAQEDRSYEFIVIDDGSTDDGPFIATQRLGSHGRMLFSDHRGPSAARNLGIMHSRGRYICFLDADDEYDPAYLATMHRLIEKYPEAGFYSCGYRLRFPTGDDVERFAVSPTGEMEFLINDFFYRRAVREFNNSNTTIIPRTVFAHIGLYRPRLRDAGEDTHMWYRIALRYPLAYVSRVLSTYYMGITGQITSGQRATSLKMFHGSGAIGTMQHALREKERTIAEKQSIGAVLAVLFTEGVRTTLRHGTPEATRYWITDVFGNKRAPLFARLAASARFRPLARACMFVQQLWRSRRMLRLRGGMLKRRGVVERLVRQPAD